MMRQTSGNVVNLYKIRRQKQKKNIFSFKIMIIVTLLLLSFLKIHNVIVSHLIQTKAVTPGTIEKTVSLNGLIIREEKIIPAPARGAFYPLIGEGARVREGQEIGYVKTGKGLETKRYTVRAPFSGLVSYSIDNLENVLNPQNLSGLNLEEVYNLKGDSQLIESGKEVFRGAPVAKITNNLHPIKLIVKVKDEDVIHKLRKQLGKNYKIKFTNDVVLTGELKEVYSNDDFVIFNINQWDKQFLNDRHYRFSLILESYSGIVLPSGAIVEKKGSKGVYISKEKKYSWKKIKVIGRVDDQVVVSGIDTGDMVVVNPEVL